MVEVEPTRQYRSRRTLTLIVVMGVVGLVVIQVGLIRGYLMPQFEVIEQTEVATRLERIVVDLHEESEVVALVARDWGHWDDSYQFVQDHNQAFIESSLNQATFENLGLDVLYYLDRTGRPIFLAEPRRIVGQVAVETAVYLAPFYSADGGLNQKFTTETAGMVAVDGRVMAVGSSPILPSSGEGEAVGTLIMGRFISQEVLERWSDKFENLVFVGVDQEAVVWFKRQGIEPPTDEVMIVPLSRFELVGESRILDIFQKPIGYIGIRMVRETYRQGWWVSHMILGLMMTVTMVAGTLVWWMGRREMASEVRRRRELSDTIQKIESQKRLLEAGDKQMKETVAEVSRKNLDMQRMQIAMMNILEDQKALDEELRLEKANVERKVARRTVQLRQKTNDLVMAQKRISEGWLQLQQEKARLTASIQSLSMGFLLTDNTGAVQVVNGRVEEIFGQQSAAWSLGSLHRLLGKIDLVARWSECKNQEREIKVEAMVSGVRWVRVLLAPIRMIDQTKQVIGVVILVEDITQAKQLEKSRDEFFAVASHELRTPLAAIQGNAALIKEYYQAEVKSEALKEMLTDIELASGRLITIVNDFLDASRLELNKLVFKTETISLRPFLERVMREIDPNALGKRLAWQLAVKPEGIQVLADPARLEQVIVNVLGNAVKFTNEGGVDVTAEQKPGQVVAIAVRDTGKGITQDDQAALFQKFKQVGSSALSRDVSQGTGMGLYISRLLIEKMGGRLFLLESTPGKGSVFVIEVPTTPY
ncbi:hypothetical protein A2W24_06475 [Microgenomates group bacterium RBG_16_45_19]|nr:MAG: hypothetical protein A2W24_06475 [Microgenomates group bacterium RBG_16_45_19]